MSNRTHLTAKQKARIVQGRMCSPPSTAAEISRAVGCDKGTVLRVCDQAFRLLAEHFLSNGGKLENIFNTDEVLS